MDKALSSAGVSAAFFAIAATTNTTAFFWFCGAAGVAFLLVAVYFGYSTVWHRRIRKKILAGFEVLHTQGTTIDPADESAFKDWGSRLELFVLYTLGHRHHQRLRTAAGPTPQIRPTVMMSIDRYLIALDRFTSDLNSSSFDGKIRYSKQAEDELRSD